MPSAPPPTPAASASSVGAKQRQHARLPVRMSAEVKRAKDSFTAATRDISEGGAGLDCDRPLVEGEEVVLGFFLVVDEVEDERNPPLWVKGRVQWSAEADDGERHNAGIRFEVITDEQKAWLRQVLGVIQAK